MNFDDLVEQKLVTVKTYDNGLSVYKYSRKVFYDNLWHIDERLLDARGMVLDAAGNRVIWPFTKVFNHGENGTTCDLDRKVIEVRKVNGFMASVTRYKDEILVATTVTLDSEYVELARKYIMQLDTEFFTSEYTWIFEICSPDDPHIVYEEEGAYLIGMRHMQDGWILSERHLDIEASFLKAKRPEWMVTTLGEVMTRMASCENEGSMIRELNGEHLMKIKSPHYLTKKAMMRMGKKNAHMMFNNTEQFRKRLDEEFYSMYDVILQRFTEESWLELKEQDRRSVIERILEEVK